MGYPFLSPIRMLLLQPYYFSCYLFWCPRWFVWGVALKFFQPFISLLLETRLPIIECSPPDVGFTTGFPDIACLFPYFKEPSRACGPPPTMKIILEIRRLGD